MRAGRARGRGLARRAALRRKGGTGETRLFAAPQRRQSNQSHTPPPPHGSRSLPAPEHICAVAVVRVADRHRGRRWRPFGCCHVDPFSAPLRRHVSGHTRPQCPNDDEWGGDCGSHRRPCFSDPVSEVPQAAKRASRGLGAERASERRTPLSANIDTRFLAQIRRESREHWPDRGSCESPTQSHDIFALVTLPKHARR